MQGRFDKDGRELPDTGFGCGCGQCADTNAQRNERRSESGRTTGEWSPMRRWLVRLVSRRRRSPQVA
jgi:hypothetical protein